MYKLTIFKYIQSVSDKSESNRRGYTNETQQNDCLHGTTIFEKESFLKIKIR